jgi:hypothetical protein
MLPLLLLPNCRHRHHASAHVRMAEQDGSLLLCFGLLGAHNTSVFWDDGQTSTLIME